MNYYMAPLEGITNYIYRQVYNRHFTSFDKYFTPFLVGSRLSAKEKREILPENNLGCNVVPQVLTNNTETFKMLVDQIKDYGYKTVNLNLGCPAAMVVSKKRGSGQLGDTEALERFFDEIFSKNDIGISVKTRIGVGDEDEWPEILKVYSKFPLEELIIHPRLRVDAYKGTPRLEAFEKAYSMELKYPVCFNGDIVSIDTFSAISERFSNLDSVMIGRGIIGNPLLLEWIKGCSSDTSSQISPEARKAIREFLDDMIATYEDAYGKNQDTNVLFKIKDIWNYLGLLFRDNEKELKAIRKSNSIPEYRINAGLLLR